MLTSNQTIEGTENTEKALGTLSVNSVFSVV